MYDDEKKGKKERREKIRGVGGSHTYGLVQIRRSGLLIAG